ncbi:MAG: hypothetical protein QM607_11840 [Microbacterium sp.]
MPDDEAAAQHVERVPGARRARLTQVPGTLGDADAEATLREDDEPASSEGETGPNDARLRRDKPPHW